MQSLNGMDAIVAGIAIVIFASALFMLVSGAWAARDK